MYLKSIGTLGFLTINRRGCGLELSRRVTKHSTVSFPLRRLYIYSGCLAQTIVNGRNKDTADAAGGIGLAGGTGLAVQALRWVQVLRWVLALQCVLAVLAISTSDIMPSKSQEGRLNNETQGLQQGFGPDWTAGA